jgi:hypothetical protein
MCKTARAYWLEIVRPAVAALRVYWPVMLLIQAAGLAVVVAYYRWNAVAELLARVARWKTEGGWLFSSLATVVSGGIAPELLKRVFRPAGISTPGAGEMAHQFVMWAWLGLLVDAFYGLQAGWFGVGNDAGTLVPKVMVDQLLYTPLVALPLIVAWLGFYEVGYRPRRWLAIFGVREMARRVLPLWAACLGFWPVMLSVVYSLPGDLQFTLFLSGNAAYSVLMIFIARRQAEAALRTSGAH